MPLQIFPKASAAKAEPASKAILDHLEEAQQELGLGDGIVFYNFPLFREEERLVVAELVLLSPWHGIILISTNDQSAFQNDDYEAASDQLDRAFSQIFSRLVRYPRLRSKRTELAFPTDAFIWAQEGMSRQNLKIGLPELAAYLRLGKLPAPISEEIFAELISVIDGSKALLRPKERDVVGFAPTSRRAAIVRLEEEIRRFDRDQRVGYMTEVGGPQRIRGLAGSGKTVVLALKAALTAIREPEAKIVVTFWTKSLYQHIKQLITRFYRMHEDKDPDWTRLQVMHAWGGATATGLYYLAARRFGHQALNYGQAQLMAPKQPFAFACGRLLSDPNVGHIFDYVFVDEAQDFPPEFMRLALRVADDEKLIIAYDVFQTIFDVEVPTAASLFGVDKENEPDIDFEEDIILHKCYRNPREILVCAHAVAFGIYGAKIVQILESREHWEDFGYEVQSGEPAAGQMVVIGRPSENSPSSISVSHSIDQILTTRSFQNLDDEVRFVTEMIVADIAMEGLAADDILVICADDKNATNYFRRLRQGLAVRNIQTNNLQDDSYSIRDFHEPGCVTLSTIYKAKGNEAFSVYIIGIDALFDAPSPQSRNRAFTAMTRAKGWLCVSGCGHAADAFGHEIITAKRFFPNLHVKYPSPEQLVYMKRDLVLLDPTEANAALDRMVNEMEPEEVEHLLRKKLVEVQKRKRARRKKVV